jgi:hypothetical protein
MQQLLLLLLQPHKQVMVRAHTNRQHEARARTRAIRARSLAR